MADKDSKKIIETAQKRFAEAASREAECRSNRLEAIKFSRLFQQWPEGVKKDRETPGQERPMLVIPRSHQFRNQVINEIRQNSPSIKIRPVGDGAHVETAEVIQGVIRHIQDTSNAEIAYDTAMEAQVDTGLGYFRIVTDYASDDGFEQDILIQRVADSFTVYLGPHTEPDGSDAPWGFVAESIPKEQFEADYPDVDTKDWGKAGTGDTEGWVDGETVRVAEYYEIVEKSRTLCLLSDGSKGFLDELMPEAEAHIVKKRTVQEKKCIWRKLGGYKVLEETEVPCTSVPIIPVLGSEVWVEGKRYLSGLTQLVMDAQRQYNYLQSASTERMALEPKTPFVAAEGQIEGYEAEWANANRLNLSVLPYKPTTIQGNLVPPPQRQAPPAASSGLESGMARSIDDMKACTGIYDASLGNREGNQSGRAIISQQQQASIGNFHFADNLKRSIKRAGKIILEMGFTHPLHIYDTARVLQILGEDGSTSTARIDPRQPQAVTQVQTETGKVEKVFNPNVGRYDVVVDTGPSYTTKRQEAVAGMAQFVQADPQILGVAGDLIVRNMDWPNADAIADRMKKALPPNLQDAPEGESPQDPQLQIASQQMQQMAQQMEHMSQIVQSLQSDKELKERELAIKEFDSVTKRMQVEAAIATVPGQIQGQALDHLAQHLEMVTPDAQEQTESPTAEMAESQPQPQQTEAMQ